MYCPLISKLITVLPPIPNFLNKSAMTVLKSRGKSLTFAGSLPRLRALGLTFFHHGYLEVRFPQVLTLLVLYQVSGVLIGSPTPLSALLRIIPYYTSLLIFHWDFEKMVNLCTWFVLEAKPPCSFFFFFKLQLWPTAWRFNKRLHYSYYTFNMDSGISVIYKGFHLAKR